ncbi:MAG: pilus assembly protein PilW [Burkholderiales bacterium PBB3]|nr:MAG: pilus assembly protein PilW [Burkholderiales bacterium PBB3]
MNNSPRTVQMRQLRGLSLIELLVSITIGLILMIAIASAYLGSSGASRVAEAQGRMNEDGQTALSILVQQVRMAGDNPRRYNYAFATPTNPAFGPGTFAIRGCDGVFSGVTTTAVISGLTCAAGTNSLPDSIAVAYEADTSNTVPTVGGLPTDCAGQGLPVSTTNSVGTWNTSTLTVSTPTLSFYVADNRFYIKTPSTGNTPSLYCKGNGGTEQPLVENVEDMQLVYGTAPATGTMTVAGFLSANSVETEATLAALTDSSQRWARVMSVRICLLMRSPGPIVPDAGSAAYKNCDGSAGANAADLRLRRTYFSTVVLRNRVEPGN